MADSERSVIRNVDFGFMVQVREGESGRARIECPVEAWDIRGPAEARHVRAAVRGWLKALRAYDRGKRMKPCRPRHNRRDRQ